MDHGGLFVGSCGVELVGGVLELVGFEGLAVGFAEHFHFVLEASSHGSFGGSSHGGCGGGVGEWCPGWGSGIRTQLLVVISPVSFPFFSARSFIFG